MDSERGDMSPFATAALTLMALIWLNLVLWIFGSYAEARAYNRATGENVSTWDAMFVELRVREAAK